MEQWNISLGSQWYHGFRVFHTFIFMWNSVEHKWVIRAINAMTPRLLNVEHEVEHIHDRLFVHRSKSTLYILKTTFVFFV